MLGKPSRRTRRKLEEHGVSAPATVLEIADSAMSVTNGSEGVVSNTELIVKTRLRVEPASGASFEVHKRFRYPQLSLPVVGTRLTVRYDPDDHDCLMLESGSGGLSTPVPGLALGDGTLGDLLATVREAQATSGGDRVAMAEQLRGAFGGQAVVLDARGGAPAAADPIGGLERLVKLRDAGALTADEFAAQKARLLGETT